MSFFDFLRRGSGNAEPWKRAVGVLPVERVLADEHEAIHDESLTERLNAVSALFDPDQFRDIPAIARALLDARDGGVVEEDADGVRLLRGSAMKRAVTDQQLAMMETSGSDAMDPSSGRSIRTAGPPPSSLRTPRDDVGLLLLRDPDLRAALAEYEAQDGDGLFMEAPHLAAALAKRFNALLSTRLFSEAAFRPFLDAVRALGLSESEDDYARRANRVLLEAVFPSEIVLLRDRRLAVVYAATRQLDTAALCLSGGGIRSSTFALGIMQGLARHGLLGKFDYLSTVSGGGLSGGWLSAWMKRAGTPAVLTALGQSRKAESPGAGAGTYAPAPAAPAGDPGRKIQPEPEPLQSLRGFSNWLTPQVGAMSLDSWTLITTVIRNLLLNWLVLVPLLASLVMLPRFLMAVLALDATPPLYYDKLLVAGLLLALTLQTISGAFLEWVRSGRGSPSRAQFFALFLAPRVLGSGVLAFAFYWAIVWDRELPKVNVVRWAEASLLAVLVTMSTVVMVVTFISRRSRTVFGTLGRGLKVLVSAATGYVVPLAFLTGRWSHELYVTLAPALLLLGSVVANQLYTGLTSNEASDAEREWAARANAWLNILAISWIAFSGLVLSGPQFVSSLWQRVALVGVGGISSWLTVMLARKGPASPGAAPSNSDKVRSAVLSLAGPAVVVSVIVGLATANNNSINVACSPDMFAHYFRCGGRAPDSTSAALLEIVSDAPRERVDTTGRLLRASLDTGTQHYEKDSLYYISLRSSEPSDDSTLVRSRGDDSLIVVRSRAFTDAVLDVSPVELHRIRRSGVFDPYYQNGLFNADTAVEHAFREHSRVRNFWLDRAYLPVVPSERAVPANPTAAALTMAPEQSGRSRVLRRVTETLATDSTLKADMTMRATAIDEIEHLVDSLRIARPQDRPAESAYWYGVLLLMAFLGFTGLFFSSFVNTNTFSLHAMWKARTVRAFLGTTRSAADRSPNPFTGFDGGDDIPLRDLWPARTDETRDGFDHGRSEHCPPMHVFNVTLNLAAGGKLAWQQRKAESMTLTPLHAGSPFTGYRPMRRLRGSKAGLSAGTGVSSDAEPGYGGPRGVSLGTAMAISGAAASPSDGSFTTPVSGMLMTFFNARLGWWLGNPGVPGSDSAATGGAPAWLRSGPQQRLTPIISEMFGLTSDRSQYVYLSDGGHFENLAIYEMILRRARFILVSDAGADSPYAFEDLGNAVRKIRIDFGVPIEFESGINIHGRNGSQGAYWATARIRYSVVDMPAGGTNPEQYDGVLVYVKPVVYGSLEPRDVVNYANLNPDFPQESSADQFFSESQFESYRELGAWIVDQLVADAATAAGNPVVVAAQGPTSLLGMWPHLHTGPGARGPTLEV